MHLEQVERGVDLFGQADGVDQPGDHPHAAVRGALGPLGQLVGDVRPPEHRAVEVRHHRLLEAPGDLAPFALEPPSQPSCRDHSIVCLLSDRRCGMLGAMTTASASETGVLRAPLPGARPTAGADRLHRVGQRRPSLQPLRQGQLRLPRRPAASARAVLALHRQGRRQDGQQAPFRSRGASLRGVDRQRPQGARPARRDAGPRRPGRASHPCRGAVHSRRDRRSGPQEAFT